MTSPSFSCLFEFLQAVDFIHNINLKDLFLAFFLFAIVGITNVFEAIAFCDVGEKNMEAEK